MSIMKGIEDLEKYHKELKLANGIITKFLENYFILDLIENEGKKEQDGPKQPIKQEEEQKDSEKNKDEQVKKMSESFY